MSCRPSLSVLPAQRAWPALGPASVLPSYRGVRGMPTITAKPCVNACLFLGQQYWPRCLVQQQAAVPRGPAISRGDRFPRGALGQAAWPSHDIHWDPTLFQY